VSAAKYQLKRVTV